MEMTLNGKKDSLLLLLGDALCFGLALFLTLMIRYLAWPDMAGWWQHLFAFTPIFFAWVVVFFISDLYRKRTMLFIKNLPGLLLRTQAVNTLVAALLFYFIPAYYVESSFAPKTNLLIDSLLTFLLVLAWRVYGSQWLYRGRPTTIMFTSGGPEVEELRRAITTHSQYGLRVVEDRATVVVFKREELLLQPADFYQMLFNGVRLVSLENLYEEIFERVPLSLLSERWFLDNISSQPKPVYDFFKRVMDIVLAVIIGLISLPFYPLVYLLVKLTDGGPVFFWDTRVGKGGRIFRVPKFRSMSNEADLALRRVTALGAWLRKTRIDELPQLWSVIIGQQSFIGPRPEKPDYVSLYQQRIPFYDARHLIAPGLSGWAQIHQHNHPHFQPKTEATAEKLSYDLYYLRHRSLWLDLKIALKTIRTILSMVGV
jgi:lipopolysaccharide/colanic/teichoic acid biosynthesis glycosyltransferase